MSFVPSKVLFRDIFVEKCPGRVGLLEVIVFRSDQA